MSQSDTFRVLYQMSPTLFCKNIYEGMPQSGSRGLLLNLKNKKDRMSRSDINWGRMSPCDIPPFISLYRVVWDFYRPRQCPNNLPGATSAEFATPWEDPQKSHVHLSISSSPLPIGSIYNCGDVVQRHPTVALRHHVIWILPPCGMMSLKDLKDHHCRKRGGTFRCLYL
jgi:hypothetical protein